MLLHRFKSETDRGLRMAYASALGKLRVDEAVEPMLEFLGTSENRAMRLELTLALVRILGEESGFIRLSRQFPAAFGTAAAQMLEALGKRIERNDPESGLLVGRIKACADAFAHDDLGRGIALLQEVIEMTPRERIGETAAHVLEGCARGLARFGLARPEYVFLALQALNEEWRLKERRREA